MAAVLINYLLSFHRALLKSRTVVRGEVVEESLGDRRELGEHGKAA